jgi:hypothetical protein
VVSVSVDVVMRIVGPKLTEVWGQQMVSTPFVLSVHPSLPVRSVKELISASIR